MAKKFKDLKPGDEIYMFFLETGEVDTKIINEVKTCWEDSDDEEDELLISINYNDFIVNPTETYHRQCEYNYDPVMLFTDKIELRNKLLEIKKNLKFFIDFLAL